MAGDDLSPIATTSNMKLSEDNRTYGPRLPTGQVHKSSDFLYIFHRFWAWYVKANVCGGTKHSNGNSVVRVP